MLGTWAREHVMTLSAPDLNEFETIINHESPDLLLWLVRNEPVPDDVNGPVMRRLLEYTRSASKSWYADGKKVGHNQ